MQEPETVSPEFLLKHIKQWAAVTPNHTQIVAASQTPQQVERKLQEQQVADAPLKYVRDPHLVLST
mgnify:CR=1 FL=1